MAYGFDDYLDGNLSGQSRSGKPIWTLNLDDPNAAPQILSWLNMEKNYILTENEARFNTIKQDLGLYKGVMYFNQDQRQSLRETGYEKSRFPRKLVINQLHDLTEQRVSRLLKFKPGISILPRNDEFGDKISAKIVKSLLDTIWYQTGFDTRLAEQSVRITDVCGESYTFIEWDPDLGDTHPDYQGEPVQLLDEHGAPVKDQNGEEVVIDQPIHVGDVHYRIELPLHVLVQRVRCWDDVDYVFRQELVNTDEVRLRHPKEASKIHSDVNQEVYDYNKMEPVKMDNMTVVWHFYHKRNRPMPGGRYIKFTKDVILSNTEYPYSMKMELPVERMTDIEVPGELHAMSFFSQIKQAHAQFNNLNSMIIKNQIMASHPKWVMPVGSAKVESLGNDITIVQYKGPVPPQLVQSNPTPLEIFEYRKTLKDDIQQLSGIFGVSRGEPPAGIKAGVALQFLSEQENERQNSKVARFNEYIRRVAQKTIAVAGDYYDASDDRMIRVIGKNNQWLTDHFDSAHLSKPYDVIVQNSSALPNSRPGRAQYLIDLNDAFPDLLPKEQILELLDLAQSEKFFDLTTQSIRSAEAENEDFMDGKPVEPPTPEEEHILHWRVHLMQMRDRSFKTKAPPETKKGIQDHLMAHEMFMIKQAQLNPTYLAKLSALDGFPIFMAPPALAPAAPMEAPPVDVQNINVNPEQLPVNPQQPPEAELSGVAPQPLPSAPVG